MKKLSIVIGLSLFTFLNILPAQALTLQQVQQQTTGYTQINPPLGNTFIKNTNGSVTVPGAFHAGIPAASSTGTFKFVDGCRPGMINPNGMKNSDGTLYCVQQEADVHGGGAAAYTDPKTNKPVCNKSTIVVSIDLHQVGGFATQSSSTQANGAC